MHHLLAFAKLYIGDSQTMAAESAVLGTPSFRLSDFAGKLGYLEELEHNYGLTFGFKPSESEILINKMEELLTIPDLKREWQFRRQKMIKDKIDLSDYLTAYLENFKID